MHRHGVISIKTLERYRGCLEAEGLESYRETPEGKSGGKINT